MKKLTIEIAQKVAEKRGGKCLSVAYINNCTNMSWECGKGHRWEAIYNNIRRGKWCPKCNHGAPPLDTIENMQKLAKIRGGRCISDIYKGTNIHLKWECGNKHKWEAQPANIKTGTWCPYCSKFKSESVCREYFETIFNKKFPKFKPIWLRNPKTKNYLELDGFCEKLGIAFEHQGEQHYVQTRMFSKTKEELKKIKSRDRLKRKLCKENKIVLIEIPALGTRTKIENLESFILKELSKYGIIP